MEYYIIISFKKLTKIAIIFSLLAILGQVIFKYSAYSKLSNINVKTLILDKTEHK